MGQQRGGGGIEKFATINPPVAWLCVLGGGLLLSIVKSSCKGAATASACTMVAGTNLLLFELLLKTRALTLALLCAPIPFI